MPTYIDIPGEDLPKSMQSSDVTIERNREHVSIHVNASSNDNQWHTSNGWQVYVSPNASQNSRIFAGHLFDAAKAHGLSTGQQDRENLQALVRSRIPIPNKGTYTPYEEVKQPLKIESDQ